MNWDTNVCPYCGHDYRFVAAPLQKKASNMPTIGGILVILAGLLAVVMAISLIMFEPSDLEDLDYQMLSDSGLTLAEIDDLLEVCGAVDIVFGAIAIIGGTFALMRKHFALAVIGGIFGMIGVGFLVGGLLGLIGLVLVVVSKAEFE